jgi:hypothetical protein
MQCYSKGIFRTESYVIVSTIRRNIFTKDDGNFTADLQNVSFMSLDESIGKIEDDSKEEASVVEVFQDVNVLGRT